MKALLLAMASFALGVSSMAETVFHDGFIRSWSVSAPIPESEAGKAESLLLMGKDAGLRWQNLNSDHPILKTNGLFAKTSAKDACVFAKAKISSKENFAGALGAGCSEAMTVFFGGKAVLSSKTRGACVPDRERVRLEIPEGESEILLRIDAKGKAPEFAIRAATTQAQLERLSFTLQNFKAESWMKRPWVYECDDFDYKYFMRPPFLKRSENPAVRFAIMAHGGNCTEKEMRPIYKLCCDSIPTPDILEIRAPVYALYDAKTGAKSGHLEAALEEAAKTKAKNLELNLTSVYFGASETNPEVAPDMTSFFKTIFKGQVPEYIRDENGKTPDAHTKKYDVNSFSYYDERVRKFTVDYIEELSKTLAARKDLRVSSVNFRFPGPNDWYYPPLDGFYDYSKPTVSAFRSFLKGKYGEISKLNEAYCSNYEDFASVDAPKPLYGKLNVSRRWQDWQDFRTKTVYEVQKTIIESVAKANPDLELTSWMTSAIHPASRDAVVLDYGALLAKEFPKASIALTCFEYFGLPGELAGQLADAYGVEIGAEPVVNGRAEYLKTFFNVLRFPVKKVNWIFWSNQTFGPASVPWITWVMNQRGLADELRGAKLIQEDTACVFSYSDVLLRTPRKLWDSSAFTPQVELYRAFQRQGVDLPMLTDYSLSIPLDRYKGVLLADASALRPEMIAKIADFVKKGGKAFLVGATGEWDLTTGERDFPLLRALGVDENDVKRIDGGLRLTKVPSGGKIFKNEKGLIEEASWSAGGGRVHFKGASIASLVENGVFTPEANALLDALNARRPVEIEKEGLACSFVKENAGAVYLGFINISDGAFATAAEYRPMAESGRSEALELVSGETTPMENGRFELAFEMPWQVKVFKLKRP